MLSGIRKGKKAAKRNANKQNQEAAELLRQSLAQGHAFVPTTTTTASSLSGVDALQTRGRIQGLQSSSQSQEEDTRRIVVLHNPNNHKKREADMTVQELVHHERHSDNNWDEEMARNLMRTGGKKQKKTNHEDSDDEVEGLRRLLPHQETTQNVKPKAVAKAQARQEHRLVHQHHRQEAITSKCAWWIESSSFVRHRLVAVGNHVSLVMAPPNMSLINNGDPNFYLVPIKHASSFVSCEPEVWEEVYNFVHSLNQVYAGQDKRMVLMETVLPAHTTTGIWQTKFHVVPVPTHLVQDCPMYFQSALREQMQDWGTHSDIFKTTRQKQLYHVIPKQKFAYFYVMWGNLTTTSEDATGYAMILEESRPRHPQDTVNFGLDTLASMMELDPIRFQRRKKYDAHQEKLDIQAFLVQWKEHDWTLQLDE